VTEMTQQKMTALS